MRRFKRKVTDEVRLYQYVVNAKNDKHDQVGVVAARNGTEAVAEAIKRASGNEVRDAESVRVYMVTGVQGYKVWLEPVVGKKGEEAAS